jgi:uncharacterized protein YkwD
LFAHQAFPPSKTLQICSNIETSDFSYFLCQKIADMNTLPSKKTALLASLFVSAVLSACGGGSGDSAPPFEVSGPTIEPPARSAASVPPGVYDDALRAAAFTRLRQVRAAAGIGVLAQLKDSLDLSAQAHSDYQVRNKVSSHDEVPGQPGYTATKLAQRIFFFGYPGTNGELSEVTTTFTDITTPADALLAQKLVDDLMSGPYHRAGMLDPEFTEVGVGVSRQDKWINLNINMARSKINTQGAPNTLLINWPPDGSTNIPIDIGTPEGGGKSRPDIPAGRGYAASVQTNCSLRGIYKITKFEMRDAAGNLVETQPVSTGCFESILPLKALAKEATYSVVFEGVISEVYDGKDSAIQKYWSFTTGSQIVY